MVAKEAHTVCQCPICNKGEVCTLHPVPEEPYWEKIVEGIVCFECGTKFNKIVLDKNSRFRKCIAYEVEQ